MINPDDARKIAAEAEKQLADRARWGNAWVFANRWWLIAIGAALFVALLVWVF